MPIGELAEILHGSPLPPITGTVTIVPRAGLTAVIAAGGGEPIGASTALAVHPAPAGTQGL